ncbi:MAG: hypothetical protein PHO42_06160 [Candidatus Omnitrophica bacterium]|nr:hypothetical protein [Candidatus Omnitrophota bacterium]
MNRLVKILIIILAVIVLLAFTKDLLIKVAIERGAQMVTGLPLRIQHFRAGVINTLIDMKGFMLSNPASFKDRVMLDAPEIYVRYDLLSIIKGTMHLPEVRIDIKEFVVVKNEKGELNLDALKTVQAKKTGKKPEQAAKAPKMQIDILQLKIGKAVYKDYSGGGEPVVREFVININEKYTNITDPNTLVSLIVFKTLVNTSISGLANFDLKELQGIASGTLKNAQKLVGDVAGEANKAFEGAGDITKGAVKGAGDVAAGAEKGVKDLIGALPFGSKEEKK